MEAPKEDVRRWEEFYRRTAPGERELERVYRVSLELIQRFGNPEELLRSILEEYERRLEKLGDTPLIPREGSPEPDPERRRQIHGLLLFAALAVALREKEELLEEVRRKTEELRKAQEALVSAERMRTALEMVRMVNHEINNPLMIITGRAQMLLGRVRRGELPEDMERSLEAIVQGARRIAELAWRLSRTVELGSREVVEGVSMAEVMSDEGGGGPGER